MIDVYLGAGHGASPTGSLEPGTHGGGRTEHAENHDVVEHAAAGFDRCGVTTTVERDVGGRHDPNYLGTTAAVNDGDYRCVIEIHHDWIKAPRGYLGLYISDAGKQLASAIEAGWAAEDLPIRGLDRRTDLYLLKHTEPPAVIVEVDRIGDHPDELNARQAEAVVRGVCGWLDIDYVPPGGPEPEPSAPAPVGELPTMDTVEDALGEVKEVLGVTVGTTWTPDDFVRILVAAAYGGVVGQLPTIALKKRHVTGPDVKRVQALLGASPYPVTIDSVYGPHTARAVRQIQTDAARADDRVAIDGIVGPQTWSLLLLGHLPT